MGICKESLMFFHWSSRCSDGKYDYHSLFMSALVKLRDMIKFTYSLRKFKPFKTEFILKTIAIDKGEFFTF